MTEPVQRDRIGGIEVRALLILVAIPLLLRAGIGADTTRAIRFLELDPSDCYRVRDLELNRGDVRYFLTDGYLIFSKPVNGSPVAVVFTAIKEGGDAEVMMLPPNRDERRVLSTHTGGPNLDEHLNDAAFLFADNTASELRRQMAGSDSTHPDPEAGAMLAKTYLNAVRSLARDFETSLLLDLLTRREQSGAFFSALLGSKVLGSFYIVFDTRGTEQLMAGQDASTTIASDFKVWSSYTPKSLQKAATVPDFRADAYSIDSRIDSKLHMRVESTFTVRDIGRDLRALAFDLSQQMHIISADVDGVAAEIGEAANATVSGADPGDRLFLIIPGTALPAGTEHRVRVVHEGDVITSASNMYFVGSRGRWYPHRNLEFSRFDLKFRFPKSLDLVAPGDPVLDLVEGDERIIERRSDVPVPMTGFNLGNYKRVTVKRGEYSVEVCANRDGHDDPLLNGWQFPAMPGSVAFGKRGLTEAEHTAADPNARMDALAGNIADVMDFYSRHFGPPPFKRLIVSPIPTRFGQGFGGIVYLSTLAYMDPTGETMEKMNSQSRIFFAQLMHAHEAAHQWWGNLVLTAGYHDEWITEALANYSAMLYLQNRAGMSAVNLMMDTYRKGLLEKNKDGVAVESAGPVTQGKRVELDGEPGAWVAVMYGKGTWIMQMLHARLGDDAFWTMLAELRRRYERKNITTQQFQELCAEFMPKHSSDPKLAEFFDQWVWGTGIPSLKLTTSGKRGTLTQSNVPEDFSADFPVQIRTAAGKTATMWVRSSSEPVAVPADFEKLELDPQRQFLKR